MTFSSGDFAKSPPNHLLFPTYLFNLTLRLMEKGVYFLHNIGVARDFIEQMVMPKVWKLTKEIREAFQATVLAPL